MKLISDAWERDDKAAKQIADMRTEKQDMVDYKHKLTSNIADMEREKENQRELAGVDEDSAEQKDLELLEKYQNNRYGGAMDEFTEDEIARLKELENTPLTEYQKAVLSLNGAQNNLQDDIDILDLKIQGYTESINLAQWDKDASKDMITTADSAEQIIEAAEADVYGMLIEEGKENIDKKADEAQEKAEETKEKAEERKEQIEENKEERKQQEEIVDGASELERIDMTSSIRSDDTDNVSKAQKQIVKIMRESRMLNEDIKGIEIDLNF